MRQLFLVDNLGLCLASGKGRSGSHAHRRVCELACAFALATGHQFVSRWVPSAKNPSDAPSRWHFYNRHVWLHGFGPPPGLERPPPGSMQGEKKRKASCAVEAW